ncbi:hypothetical protein KRMM14A1004_56150 [Krasilnikovia sp. MM14-A1004]
MPAQEPSEGAFSDGAVGTRVAAVPHVQTSGPDSAERAGSPGRAKISDLLAGLVPRRVRTVAAPSPRHGPVSAAPTAPLPEETDLWPVTCEMLGWPHR